MQVGSVVNGIGSVATALGYARTIALVRLGTPIDVASAARALAPSIRRSLGASTFASHAPRRRLGAIVGHASFRPSSRNAGVLAPSAGIGTVRRHDVPSIGEAIGLSRLTFIAP